MSTLTHVNYDGGICTFAELLRLVSAIDGFNRIRYITSIPSNAPTILSMATEISGAGQLRAYAGAKRLRSYSNIINRAYTTLEYKSIIRQLIHARPDIQISSDCIICFPGETQQDFEQTMKLIADVHFDMSFSFICSARFGTPVTDMVDDVSEKEKKQRLHILQERITQQAMQFSCRMQGKVQHIFVEGTSRKNVIELPGRTENNSVVNFEGAPSMIGKFIDAEIVDAYPHSLSGVLLRTEDQIALRSHASPASVIASTRKENKLDVGIYQL